MWGLIQYHTCLQKYAMLKTHVFVLVFWEKLLGSLWINLSLNAANSCNGCFFLLLGFDTNQNWWRKESENKSTRYFCTNLHVPWYCGYEGSVFWKGLVPLHQFKINVEQVTVCLELFIEALMRVWENSHKHRFHVTNTHWPGLTKSFIFPSHREAYW